MFYVICAVFVVAIVVVVIRPDPTSLFGFYSMTVVERSILFCLENNLGQPMSAVDLARDTDIGRITIELGLVRLLETDKIVERSSSAETRRYAIVSTGTDWLNQHPPKAK